MSLAQVQNFAISLDGFGTGEGVSRKRPFGHADERLHEIVADSRVSDRTRSPELTVGRVFGYTGALTKRAYR